MMTLVARRLYFGMDPRRLRESANRVLARDRTQLRAEILMHDFQLDSGAGRHVFEQMVQGGLLKRTDSPDGGFAITDKFRKIAHARIIEPLPRAQAQMLIAHFAEIAAHFNRTAARNKYEIEAIAAFGSLMNRHGDLPDLSIGITGRSRAPGQPRLIGRATAPTEGTDAIRALFEEQSSYVKAHFFRRLQDVPRPFSVIFKADD